MTARVAAVLAALSLVVSLTGVSPADAARAVKRALSAKNADAVDKISASREPRPGQLLALDSDGRFPASVLGDGRRGPRGAEGPQGLQGGAGPAGPPGPVEAITTKLRSATLPSQPNGNVDVVRMILPPGTWFVTGTGHGVWDPASGSTYVQCGLTVGETGLDAAVLRLGDAANATLAAGFSTHGLITTAASTTARMNCAHDQAAPGSLRIENARISALRLNTFTTQNGDGT
jgi:hypothetical protein